MTDLIINQHREALALAALEHEIASRINMPETSLTLDDFRARASDNKWRNTALRNARIRERYVMIRGFDPAMVQAAPKIRWLA